MQLSPHFTLDELVRTGTGLDNTPTEAHLVNLHTLCLDVLEPIRAELGCPLRVLSGYRSEAVNKAVGGAPLSAHRHGLAADVVPVGVDPAVAMATIKRMSDARAIPLNLCIYYPTGKFLHVGTVFKNMIVMRTFLVSRSARGSRGPYDPYTGP